MTATYPYCAPSPLLSPRAWWGILMIAVLAPLCLPQKAFAQRIFDGPALSFSNLEFGYERRFFDDEWLDDADGFHAGFSIAPIPFLYLAGDIHYANSEDFLTKSDDIDFLDARIGVGGRVTVAGTLALYLEGGAAYGKLDRPGSPEAYDGAGFYVEPGVKLGLFGRVEASVAAEMTVLEDTTLYGAKAGLMFGITDNLGLTLDAGVSEHSDYVGIGLRINW